MASRLRPVVLLALWVGGPVALYCAGYYVVGPRIGVPVKLKEMAGDQFTMLNKQVQKIVTPAASEQVAKQEPKPASPPEQSTKPEPTSTPAPEQAAPPSAQADSDGPQVEVSVHSATSARDERRTVATHKPKPKRRHKIRPKPKPKPETTDEGSYGGTQDQGTTTGGAGNPPAGG